MTPRPADNRGKAAGLPGEPLLPDLFLFSSVPSLRPLSASLFFHENLCFNSQISCVIHPVSLYREGKKFRSSKTLTRFASRLSLVHSVTPRLKTVHRIVFTAVGSFKSLSFQFIKKVTPLGGISFWRKERDPLRYPSPKNSPPDCFYSWNSVSAAGSFESLSFQFNKKSDPTGWDHFFWRKERDSLRYPSPKNSPLDCFYSRNSVSAAGSFESPSFQFNKKSDPTGWDHFFWRKERDSNPRCLYRAHTISSRAP